MEHGISLKSMDNFAFEKTNRPTSGLRLFAEIRHTFLAELLEV